MDCKLTWSMLDAGLMLNSVSCSWLVPIASHPRKLARSVKDNSLRIQTTFLRGSHAISFPEMGAD